MAFYVDFNGGSATFPAWTATGDFTIAFRTVYDSNNDLTAGRSATIDGWFGSVSGVWKTRIATTVYDTLYAVANGDEIVGTMVRSGVGSNNVTITLNGTPHSFTTNDTFTLDKIGGNSSATYASTVEDLYYLNLDNGSDVRTYESDGVGLPDTTSAQDATLAGSYTFVEYGAVESISISEASYNNKVYQRTNAGINAVSFNVTYAGTPTSLRYRVLDAADDTTEIVGWTVFDASPTGGTSTLNYNANSSLTGYHVEVDFSNDALVTGLQTVDWYVGDVVLIAGQSLAEDMNTNGAITAVSGYFEWSGSAGVIPTFGTGANEIAKGASQGESVACLIINTAVGGSPLTLEAGDGVNHWSSISSTLFSDTITAIDAATTTVNKIAYIYWHQGTRDSLQAVTQDEYLKINRTGGLTSLFKNIHDTFTDGDGAALNIYSSTLGRDTRGGSTTDSQHQGIRNALMTMANADALVTACNTFISATTDGVHATDAAYTQMGKEIAAKHLHTKGLVSLTSPELIFVGINAGRDTLTLTFDVDLDTGDTVYSVEGLKVESNNVNIVVNSATRTGVRTVDFVLASAVPVLEQVDIYIGYGKGSTTSTLVYPRTPSASMIGTMSAISINCSNVFASLSEL